MIGVRNNRAGSGGGGVTPSLGDVLAVADRKVAEIAWVVSKGPGAKVAVTRLPLWTDVTTPDYLLVLPIERTAEVYNLRIQPLPYDGRNTVWKFLNNCGTTVSIHPDEFVIIIGHELLTDAGIPLAPGAIVSIKLIEILVIEENQFYKYALTIENNTLPSINPILKIHNSLLSLDNQGNFSQYTQRTFELPEGDYVFAQYDNSGGQDHILITFFSALGLVKNYIWNVQYAAFAIDLQQRVSYIYQDEQTLFVKINIADTDIINVPFTYEYVE